MDKYEFNLKIEQMKKLVNEEDYATALKIAESIEWERVRNTNLLTMAATVFEKNDRLDESRGLLIMALERAPVGKRILFKLAELSVRSGDMEEAEDYYHEYHEIAPDDTGNYLLQYMLLKAKHAPYDRQLIPLERYCDHDPDEKWLYELATSYEYAGRIEDSVKTCDRIALLYGDSPYSRKALRLKQRYANLSEAQSNILNPRTFTEEQAQASAVREEAAQTYENPLIGETEGYDQQDVAETLDRIQVAEEEYESYTAYTADMFRRSDELAAQRYEDEDAYFEAYVRAHGLGEIGAEPAAEQEAPAEYEAPAYSGEAPQEVQEAPAEPEAQEWTAPTLVMDVPQEAPAEEPAAEPAEEPAAYETAAYVPEEAAPAAPEETAVPEVPAAVPEEAAPEVPEAPLYVPEEAAPAAPVSEPEEAPAAKEALQDAPEIPAASEEEYPEDEDGRQMTFDFGSGVPVLVTEVTPEETIPEEAAVREPVREAAPVPTSVSARSIEISTQQVHINVVNPPEIHTAEAPAAEKAAPAAPAAPIPAVAPAVTPVTPAAPAAPVQAAPAAPAPVAPAVIPAAPAPAAPKPTLVVPAAPIPAPAPAPAPVHTPAPAPAPEAAAPVMSRPVPPRPVPQAKTSFTPKPAPRPVEPPKPAPAAPKPAPVSDKNFHMIIEAETGAQGLEIAVDELKALHEENGIQHASVKTSAEKLNQKGLTDTILEKIRGKDFVIENAGDLDDDVIEDLYDLIRTDRSGTIVVMIDTPEGLDHVEDVCPDLFDICDYISDIDEKDEDEDRPDDDFDEEYEEYDEEEEEEEEPVPAPQKRSNGKPAAERFNNVKAVAPAGRDEEMEIDDFAQYCAQYAASIDCSITGKSMLALYERIELMEEDGIPLTRANAEQLIEEAADRAEKPPIGKRLTGIFKGKYDKNGLLILKEEDFIF